MAYMLMSRQEDDDDEEVEEEEEEDDEPEPPKKKNATNAAKAAGGAKGGKATAAKGAHAQYVAIHTMRCSAVLRWQSVSAFDLWHMRHLRHHPTLRISASKDGCVELQDGTNPCQVGLAAHALRDARGP